MSLILKRDDIRQHNGKYSLAPPVKPKPQAAPLPAIDTLSLASAIAPVVTALNASAIEQRTQMAGMLAALAKPEPQHDNWTVTITQRDAKGRIQQLDFIRKTS